MKYARVVNSIVFEVFTPQPGFAIEECFTPEIVAQFEPCPGEVQPNWIKQAAGTFAEPPAPPAPIEPEHPIA